MSERELARRVEAVTSIISVPRVPELQLRLLHPAHPLWRAIPDEAAAVGVSMPYWAVAWPGGQVLARFLLDHPEWVRRRRVLDLGSGGAIVGLAALRAGASAVSCADVDPLAAVAARLNAHLNAVTVDTITDDLLLVAPGLLEVETILVGDLFYDEEITARLVPWLRTHRQLGREVLVGDAGRLALPEDFVSLASMSAPFDGNPLGSTDWQVHVRRLETRRTSGPSTG